jgi:tetratricopeptide (TPR) repeat protein
LRLFSRGSVVCLLLLSVCRAAGGSTAFLRVAPSTPPEPAQIRTYAGKAEVTSSPVKLSPSLTVVILADTLNADSFESVRNDLLALQTSLHGHPLRVALIRNGSLGVTGPFSTRARLKSALDQIPPATATDPATPVSSSAVFDVLNATVEQLGAEGSHVLLIGEFPDLDPRTLDFASALLVRSFGPRRIQVSWFAPVGGSDNWLSFVLATSGTIVHGPLSGFASFLDAPSEAIQELDWNTPAPQEGFVVSHAILADQDGHTLLDVPDIAASANASLPTVELYADMVKKAADAASLLNQGIISEAAAQSIRDDIQKALDVNSRDEETLLTASVFYEQLRDYSTAAKHRSSLIEVRPFDGTAYAALGHVLLLNGDLDESEAALDRTTEMNAVTPQVNEDFARIHLARKDDKGAIPYLDDALRADAKRQDLWFLQAEAANRLKDSSLAIQSFEQGLGLGGFHLPESSSLLRLYLAEKQNAKALELAQKVTTNLPADLDVRAVFAGTLEDLQLHKEALAAWRRVLEFKPDFERAHYRIARLLLESGDPRAADEAADAGLLLLPRSANLYIVKADALEKKGETYSARSTLERGAAAVTDPALLSRLAAIEDTFGGSAAGSYAKLAESLGNSSPERLMALERGFTVALRDGDLDRAQSFAGLLESAGHAESQGLLSEQARDDTSTIMPGGLDALAFAARLQEHVLPDRFFVPYCQMVVDLIGPSTSPDKKLFISEIQEHFERLSALEAVGKRDGNRLVITLSLDGKNGRRNSEKVLGLLGIKLRTTQGAVELDLGEKKSQTKKQDTLSALAIDEVGMQEAFRAGKPYTLEIPYDRVSIYPSEKLWRDAFYAKDNAPGGFATAVLHMPKMASLYIAFSFLDKKTISELLSAVNLGTLYDHYSDLMYLFSPAFAVQNNHASVPGGPNAETIWGKLVGVSPQQPGAFFRALLDHEGGKLLAYYFTLSQLDRPHQAFFTAHYSRTEQFYKLFASSKEMERGISGVTRDSTFREILRSVPLDRDGRVNFPGSAEVWTVAKGRSASEAQTTKLLKRVSKAVAPELEDEVLLRLAGTEYSEHGTRLNELQNFLSVSRIDAHRSEPLDEESALLLAQHFSNSSSAYAYFTDLIALGAPEFRQFFSAVDRIKSRPPLEANLELGQLHALVEWICLLNRRHAIGDGDAAQLFKQICDRFASANGEEAYTTASLDSARSILLHCLPEDKTASLDVRIRACLLGPVLPGGPQEVDYRHVLEEQKVPSLHVLISIYQEAAKWSMKTPRPEEAAAIEKSVAAIPSVGLPKDTKIRGREKDAIAHYETSPILKIMSEVNQKIAKRKVKREEVEKLSKELMADLGPQVTLALVGPIYGYFLRSTDLVESADALLLRKHHYLNFAEGGNQDANAESAFHKDNEGVGSYFLGGFAEFPLAAGSAANVGWRNGGGPGAGESVVAEIAAIRATNWERLEESDQRLLSLRVSVAREWIVKSADRPDLLDALSEETLGLLSPTRRADLLNGIESRNWRKVWSSAMLPDLFTVGGMYLNRFKTDPWSSPATAALRAVASANDGSRLQVLGAITYHTFGCGHTHLFTDAPYEEYERQLLSDELAERSAEFKLFLAFLADSAGVQPSSLAGVAETLAGKAFRAAQMNSSSDWRSLLAAYASVTTDDLRKALEP